MNQRAKVAAAPRGIRPVFAFRALMSAAIQAALAITITDVIIINEDDTRDRISPEGDLTISSPWGEEIDSTRIDRSYPLKGLADVLLRYH